MQPVVGSIDNVGVGTGRFELNGTVTMYFEDKAAYELFLNGTAADLTFSIGGASTKKYQFTIGKIKFSDADVPTPGNNQDILITLPFQALYNSTDSCSLKITRTP